MTINLNDLLVVLLYVSLIVLVIVLIVLAFMSWLIGVITEKGFFHTLAAIFLGGAIIFLACLVGIL